MWAGYFTGTDNVIEWEHLQEQKVIETNVHSFRLGPFVLDVPAESYVILEYLAGSQVVPATAYSYIYLAILFASLPFLLAAATVLSRTWFYVAVALASVFLFGFRIEDLGLFGVYSKAIPLTLIGVLLVVMFYFNQIKPATPFVIRVGSLAGIIMVSGILIGFFSQETRPFYHLVVMSFTPALILSMIFMVIVAHEIFASFVYIASQGSSKSIQHLTILSVIYLANIILTVAHELRLLSFDLIYLDVFLLLSVSSVLGVWGFRMREAVYQDIIAFAPFGALFFLALGSICFATIGHLAGNANDPGVFVLRHAILFSQAGYGLMFLLYVLSNFGPMLAQNGPVHKVLYLPKRMPYFTFSLAGLIATLAIFFFAHWRSYVYNAFAAFYNTYGDLHTLRGDGNLGYSFYLKSSSQGVVNHRANYALAVINARRYNFYEADEYIKKANLSRATPYSLVNRGNIFIRAGRTEDAIDAFRTTLRRFPGEAAIENNLGVSFLKTGTIDSALFYLSSAREKPLTKSSAETNFFGMAASEAIPMNIDSVYRIFGNTEPALLSNLYALSSVLDQPVSISEDPLSSEQLNLYTATYLNNYIIRNARSLDSTFTARAYALASDSVNTNFSEALKASLAYAYYYQGNVSRALELLADLVYVSQSYQGKFNYIMGVWALEQNNPELAATYFNFADTYDYKEAPFYKAIAFTEAGDLGEALAAWDSLRLTGTTRQKDIAANMRRILTMNANQLPEMNDPERYQFCRYRISPNDSLTFNRVAAAFTNENYRAQALLDFSRKLYDAGYVTPSIQYYQKIAGLQLSSEELYEDIRHFELILLAARGDLRGLASQINKGITFDQRRQLEKIYYTALLNEASGDTINAAKNYRILSSSNPYFEDGVIAAFNYVKKHSANGFDAYNILAEAIQINNSSIPLLQVYQDEAERLGFDDYAAATAQRIRELRSRGARNR